MKQLQSKIIIIAVLLPIAILFLPLSVHAGIRNCNASLVTGGICNSSTDGLLFFSLSTTDPDGAGPRVSQAIQVQEGCALLYQYQSTINGVSNPETKAAFCERTIRVLLFKAFQDLYYRIVADTARDTALTLTPSDVVP